MLTSPRLCMRLHDSVASCPEQAPCTACPALLVWHSDRKQPLVLDGEWRHAGWGVLRGSSSRQDRVRDHADEQLRTKLLPMGGILAKDLDKLAGHIEEAAVPGALKPVWQTLRQLRQQRGRCLPCAA